MFDELLHRVQLRGPESLDRPRHARTTALTHPSIWCAAHIGLPHPNRIPCRSSAEAQRALSWPLRPTPLTLHVAGPRIAVLEYLKSYRACFRSAVPNRLVESVPRQSARALSIANAWRELARLRRPPAGRILMSEKALKLVVVYPRRHQMPFRID